MNPTAALILLPFLGFFLGGYGAAVGLGSGFLYVVALLLLFPDDPPQAVAATSLVAVAVTAMSGYLAYHRLHRVDYHAGITLAVAGIPGAIAGAFVTGVMGRRVFESVFAVLLIVMAIYMVLAMKGRRVQGNNPAPDAPPRSGMRALTDNRNLTYVYQFHRTRAVVAGFLAPFFGTMVGVGGGVLLVPALVTFVGLPAQIAMATSTFAVAFNAVAGAATQTAHVGLATIWLRALLLGASGVVGAQVGARLASRVSSRVLLRLLAVMMVAAAARLLVAAF
ncbi:MAG: sulfite exporter TauE/SafE family protein [Chloroflexi bacterium]|nr:sulfite exporter TauE/SafE family protein [Chloroflexota bacterium]